MCFPFERQHKTLMQKHRMSEYYITEFARVDILQRKLKYTVFTTARKCHDVKR